MGSTYLDLTNKLLRRLNEVQLTETDFASARNIQATAKDCIQDAIRDINMFRSRWPFNAYEYTFTVIPGTEEYVWPANFHAVDWNSFQVQKDDTLNVNSQTLIYIPRDQWYERLKDRDYDSHPDGVRMPMYVYQTHGNGFGISPSPDRAYTIKFRYFVEPETLVDFSDTTTIPTKYDHVIISGALYWMNSFKGDAEASQLQEAKFKELVKQMANQLIMANDKIYDSRVNFGGGNKSSWIWLGN